MMVQGPKLQLFNFKITLIYPEIVDSCDKQWWITQELKYKSVHGLEYSYLCNFILLLYYISEANIVLFTALCLSDS